MTDDLNVLQEIERKYGRVSAEHVVTEAADPDHPWHSRINWNDQQAAHRYRLDQARQIIRSVRYERRVETRVLNAVAYVRDPDAPADEQAYVSVATLTTDADRARSAILAEFSRVASALKRARELAAILAVDKQVEGLIETVEGLAFVLRNPAAIEGPAAAQ